jgi:hypothetical protein
MYIKLVGIQNDMSKFLQHDGLYKIDCQNLYTTLFIPNQQQLRAMSIIVESSEIPTKSRYLHKIYSFIHLTRQCKRRIKANEINFNSIQSLYLCRVNFLVLMPVRFSTYLRLPQERRSQASPCDTGRINLFEMFYSSPDWNGQGPGQPSPSIHCLAAMSPVVVIPPPAPWRPTLAPLCGQIWKVYRYVSENKDD